MLLIVALTFSLAAGQEFVAPTIEEQLEAGAAWVARGIPDQCLVMIAESGGASLDNPGILEAARQRAQVMAGLAVMADEASQEAIIRSGYSRALFERKKFDGELTEAEYDRLVAANNRFLSDAYQQLWSARARNPECLVFGPDGRAGLTLVPQPDQP